MVTSTDSISIFAEGTYEEQILELSTYLVRNRPEEERLAFTSPLRDAFRSKEGNSLIEVDEARRKLIFSKVFDEVKGLGDGNEKEVEGFFNLLYAHLFALYPADSSEAKAYLTTLLQTLSSSPSDRLSIKYRILANLFNSIPRNSPLRLAVYNTLLALATSNDDLEILKLSRADVEKWLSEWNISQDEKSTFLKSIVDAYAKAGELTTSYEYSLVYIRTLPSTSSASREAVINAIVAALRLPNIFDFDPLFKLDAVVNAKDHELFSLLQIFLNDGLVEFKTWEQSHQGLLEKYNLESAQLERKIRLLTLASLGCQYIGNNLPYSKIAESLQVDLSEVEKWVIDVIRAGLVWGKLSQTAQSLHISRATSRTFERKQWEVLEKRLVAWKSGLAGILEVVSSAKRLAGHAPAHSAA
ncbi:uncharacterized protein LACBIDRAFT_311474 [Laccaria bicolor S238N-H82]|uniref:Eukaryotic translation initiation factor 3 subunit M n=1 Tax=Laccaria bicolor (strain S238N-H82 / ATCC MYA-4686) TaxID=486041 RepID=B0CXG6_LACBS|nr:uncharacterized protein LACBIDRAFT_311474 [Laccaria bicolor S238N-H82]EDR12258.1 predicted protein [Laccaria bicolor S238N-H82]|eukprot:XP_001876522.1 predicted protein [Laccaria bicolor S238N-H82]